MNDRRDDLSISSNLDVPLIQWYRFVRDLEVDIWRNHGSFERKNDLDEAGYSTRISEMADVRLQRTNEQRMFTGSLKRIVNGSGLDRFSYLCAGAMGLKVLGRTTALIVSPSLTASARSFRITTPALSPLA